MIGEKIKSPCVLGIEGGATRTSVLLVSMTEEVVSQFVTDAANLKLMSKEELELHLYNIKARLPVQPRSIGIGLAGVRTEKDVASLCSIVNKVWPDTPCVATDDLMTALETEPWDQEDQCQILVLSGTGSCFLGRRKDGEEVRIGGRGHILGDRASACDIAQTALRTLMARYDSREVWPKFGEDVLQALSLNEPEALIDWSLVANKTELASVAKVVFEAAKLHQDPIALEVIKEAAKTMTKDATATARQLNVARYDSVQFVFNGGILLNNRDFLKQVGELLHFEFPNAKLSPLERPSTWGAVNLGKKLLREIDYQPLESNEFEKLPLWTPLDPSPTEGRNPTSTGLDTLPLSQAIDLFIEADRCIPDAIKGAAPEIEQTIQHVVSAFKNGGRLLYIGSGTSGRLGVLDASECPPTFRVLPSLVQGIIAGGQKALWSAAEGAEDDIFAGAKAIGFRNVTAKDVVIAISASGHAPFIWGGLKEARQRGAQTVLITSHPSYAEHPLPDQVIVLDTGPEILTGSTRLKAGTATKMTLNIITTLAMTHYGKVISNLMVDLNPSNSKLRERATQIVSTLCECSPEKSRKELQNNGWHVREAIKVLSKV